MFKKTALFLKGWLPIQEAGFCLSREGEDWEFGKPILARAGSLSRGLSPPRSEIRQGTNTVKSGYVTKPSVTKS